MSFAARYDGECDDCEQPIHRGDNIRYNGRDEVAHENCPRWQKPCEACHLIHAGECDE